jgi:S-formylglutathione hydrolase FrmB
VRRALAVALGAIALAGCGATNAPSTGTSTTASAKPAPPPGGIAVVAERRLDPRLTEWTLRTSALGGQTRVRVLVPAGYDTNRVRRYPVLYLLHGRNGSFSDWTRYGGVERATTRTPLIVVMPDGGAEATYTGRWTSYHTDQLVRWVDTRFRTIAARRGRSIAGLSMGGFGALSYAARTPQTYAAAASFSGALEVGSAAAWGERSANEARWRAHLPISIAARLRSLALVELRTGDGRPGPLDRRGTKPGCPACALERFLYRSNARLHARLRALGIRHVWDDYGAGTHDWPYWRRDLRETLPDLAQALARA